MQQLICLSKRDNVVPFINDGYYIVDTTSHSTIPLYKQLSPFYLHTVEYPSIRMENAWQFSKIYDDYFNKSKLTGNAIQLTFKDHPMLLPEIIPCQEWLDWASNGTKQRWAIRYPMGKGTAPVCALYKQNNRYYCTDYIQSRMLTYIPLYAHAVVRTDAYQTLKQLYQSGQKIALLDFDGYNYTACHQNLQQVLYNPKRKMGHSFVLAMLLTGYIPEN